MDLLPMIISLVSGAAGGNVAGALMKKFSMGTALNSIVGILGGGLGKTILGALGMGGMAAAGDAGSAMDIGSILSAVAGGGVGGGALMAIIGVVKNMMGGNNDS